MEKKGSVFPFYNKTNAYIDIMKEIFTKANCNIVKISKVKILFHNIDFISLNWTEGQVNGKSRIKIILKFYLVYLYIVILKHRTNIIWTMHNKKPHNYSELSDKYSSKLMDLLIEKANIVLIHSYESASILLESNDKKILEKTRYLPHPHYINYYGEVRPSQTDNETLKLLFMGSVSPYKNVDILVQAIKELDLENIELAIYGKASVEYSIKIKHLIENDTRIKINFEFVKDEDIPTLFSNYHILVTPYDLNSSLNSGTQILAFSYKTTVLSPLNGTLKDLDEIENSFFSYTTYEKEQQILNLKSAILSIYYRYNKKFNEINELGENCYNYVLANNDPLILSKKLSTYLDEL